MRPTRRALLSKAHTLVVATLVGEFLDLGRQTAVATAQSTSPTFVDRAAWGARAPSGQVRQHQPDSVTIHHTAVRWVGGDTAAHVRVIQAFHQGPERRWADIAYHYLIDRDGTAYVGRPELAVGDTATDYDPTGHLLLCLLGDLDSQPVVPEQVDGVVQLTAWLLDRYHLPVSTIAGHSDFAATSCPGRNLASLLHDGTIPDAVRQQLVVA